MVQECYSPERPARVLCFKRDGRTEVRLRRNIAEDESDGGIVFWRCEESAFTVPGAMTEADAEARFDELWEEHEDDGEAHRCEYVSPSGVQCRNMARPGSRYCGVHEQMISAEVSSDPDSLI